MRLLTTDYSLVLATSSVEVLSFVEESVVELQGIATGVDGVTSASDLDRSDRRRANSLQSASTEVSTP